MGRTPTYYGVTGPLPAELYEHYTRTDGIVSSEVTVLPECVSPGFFDLFRLLRLQSRDITWDDGPGMDDFACRYRSSTKSPSVIAGH